MTSQNNEIGSAHAVRPDLILAICCLSLLLVGMDVTIVNVALPAIQKDLHANITGLQWIVDSYTLVVASLLMFSGAMSDRFGRRRVFQIGLALFTSGSLLCSVAPGIGWLIAFRALQGLGASMLNPVALSIIANVFPAPRDRARAVGIWGAVAGVSLALGPLLGGALTQTIGWRSIFWINVPVGIGAIVLAALFIPESKAPRARRLDPLGQLLIFTGLASLCGALIQGSQIGWSSPWIGAMFVVSLASAIGFLLYEPRCAEPLLDLRFFRSVPFASATILALCAFASFAGFLFLNALYLQQVRHLSAVRTGFYTLPLAVAMTLTAPLSGRLVGRYGPRPSLLAAGTCLVISTGLLTALSDRTPAWMLLTAYALFGAGLGMVNPAITNSAVAGMPLSQAGVAAAIASTSRQVGATLGVAVSGTVAALSPRAGADFARATHPIWWATTALGMAIWLLGWASTSQWALGSVERTKHLLNEPAR